jgi:glycosyltransferase involved in cell wall biosynthesis
MNKYIFNFLKEDAYIEINCKNNTDSAFKLLINIDLNQIIIKQKSNVKEIYYPFLLNDYFILVLTEKDSLVSIYLDYVFIQEIIVELDNYCITSSIFKPEGSKEYIKKDLSHSNSFTITLLNEKIYIPKYLDYEYMNFLKTKYEKEIYNFISSRVFYKKNKIFELISENHLYAIALAKIFSNFQINIIVNNKQLISELIEKNNISNIQIITNEQLSQIDEESIVFSENILQFPEVNLIDNSCDIISFEDKEISSNEYISKFRTNRNIHVKDKYLEINLHKFGISNKMTHFGLDIVVSMFNSKDYIVECINSLISSNRNDIRILVVNDGSTDGSDNIVKNLFGDNKQVILLNKLNGGCASARNYGRSFSTSSHIAFVDADDFVDANYYELLYDISQYTGREIVQGNFVFYDNTTGEITPNNYIYETSETDFNFCGRNVSEISFYQEMNSQPTIWRKVYRRDFLDSKNLYFPECIRAFDDFYFHLMTSYFISKILVVPGINYYYRQHPLQDIKQGDSRHFNELYMFNKILQEVIELGRWNFRFWSTSFINSINWSISKLREDLIQEYINSSVEILVCIKKIYGDNGLTDEMIKMINSENLKENYYKELRNLENIESGVYLAYIRNKNSHPNLLNFGQKVES